MYFNYYTIFIMYQFFFFFFDYLYTDVLVINLCMYPFPRCTNLSHRHRKWWQRVQWRWGGFNDPLTVMQTGGRGPDYMRTSPSALSTRYYPHRLLSPDDSNSLTPLTHALVYVYINVYKHLHVYMNNKDYGRDCSVTEGEMSLTALNLMCCN